MERQALLAVIAVVALPLLFIAAAAAILAPHASTNRGWIPSLKPGAIVTKVELEGLKREGWRLVRAPVFRGGGYHDAPCPSGLLLAYRPRALGLYAYVAEGGGWRHAEWLNATKTVELSPVANATIHYRVEPALKATVYEAPIAYCLEKLNETAYRVVNYLRPAYYALNYTLKPREITVKVDHEAFWRALVRVLNESLVVDSELAEMARTWRGPRFLRLLGWRVVEKRVCGVTVVLDVPLVAASGVYLAAYLRHPVYEKLVIAPLVTKLLGGCGKRAEWWLDYSDAGARLIGEKHLLPPAVLVYGGVCSNYAGYTMLLARALGFYRLAYQLDTGTHAAVVLCTGPNHPVYFPAVDGGRPGYYGLLAAKLLPDGRPDLNHTLICWLFDDTGYAAVNWRRIRGTIYHDFEIYVIVKTWVGRRVPSLNVTAGG